MHLKALQPFAANCCRAATPAEGCGRGATQLHSTPRLLAGCCPPDQGPEPKPPAGPSFVWRPCNGRRWRAAGAVPTPGVTAGPQCIRSTMLKQLRQPDGFRFSLKLHSKWRYYASGWDAERAPPAAPGAATAAEAPTLEGRPCGGQRRRRTRARRSTWAREGHRHQRHQRRFSSAPPPPARPLGLPRRSCAIPRMQTSAMLADASSAPSCGWGETQCRSLPCGGPRFGLL